MMSPHLPTNRHMPPLELLFLLQQPHSRLIRQRTAASLPHARVALTQRCQPEVLPLNCSSGGRWELRRRKVGSMRLGSSLA